MKIAAVILCFWISQSALARWAEPSAAYVAVEFIRQNVNVHEDGTSDIVGEVQAEFTNEAVISGRNHFTQVYSQPMETFEVLEAKTILPDRTIAVPKEMIEDKPVASHGHAVEDLRQISVTFPALTKGAKIFVRYKSSNNQKIVPGYFSWSSIFQDGQYIKKWETTITAPFPLFAELNDPWKNFEMKSSRKGDDHVVKVSLKGPYFRYVVEEDNAFAFPEERPWVTVTSTRDWNVPYRKVAMDFEAELKNPMPKLFVDIAASVKKLPPGPALLNALTDKLGDSIRYVSDTRKLEGLLAPRSLTTVAETGYGDCKDFATAIVAMMRSLGYDANIAIIEGALSRSLPLGVLPSLSYFNHAIARVQIAGKVYWIDGTSDISHAEGTSSGISDRQSLVLYAKAPKLEFVKPVVAEQNLWWEKSEYWVKPKAKQVHFDIKLEARGSSALHYVGAQRREEKLQLAYRVLSGLENMSKIREWKFDDFDLTSRSYRDVNFHFYGESEDPFLKTTSGKAISWNPSNEIQKLLMRPESRVAHVDLGTGRQIYELILRNAKLVGKPIACEVKSKWFDGVRTVKQTAQGIALTDNYIIKESLLKMEEMKAPFYGDFQKRLEKCFSTVAVLFKALPYKKVHRLAE